MKSIKSEGFEPKKNKTSNIFKISLSIVFAAFVLIMSPDPFNFGLIEETEAAGLTSVSVVPASNIKNERATYDIFLKTATSGTIKTIEVTFPSSFDLTQATKLIEREGIGSGSLSSTGSTLKYTVNSPVSVSAGTTIRLEIARIIAKNAGSFTASISTLNTANGQIDGPTNSGSFVIKSIGSSDIGDNTIASSDVSTGFMKTIQLLDDDVGHAHGWNPDGATKVFLICCSISDINLQSAITAQTSFFPNVCDTVSDNEKFHFTCNFAPPDTAAITFTIINAPISACCSSASVTTSNEQSITHSSQYESTREHDQISSEFP